MAIRVPSATTQRAYGYVEGRALACPVQLQPTSGTTLPTSTSATLEWGAVVNAKTYRVYLWEASEVEPAAYTAETASTTYTASGLVPGATYRWRVTAFSVFGASSGCGDGSFTINGTPPECPALIFPEDDSTTLGATSVNLQWGAVSDASEYYVFLWPSIESQPATPIATTTSISYQATGLQPTTSYDWTIQSVNDAGVSSGCGASTFTTLSTSVEFTAPAYPAESQSETVVVSVQRSGSSVGAISVQYATSDDTAIAGTHYTSVSGTLHWADGDSANKTFNVPVLDGDDYALLSLDLTLSNPVGTTIGEQGTAVVTIPPLYEFSYTTYVNINARNFKQATSPGAPGGTIVTIATNATDRVILTKPSVAENSNMLWDALSVWATDDGDPPGDGLTWLHRFRISDQDNALLQNFSTARGANAAAALAIMQALTPITLSGSVQYKFWSWDSPISDNRGGLSLKADVYVQAI